MPSPANEAGSLPAIAGRVTTTAEAAPGPAIAIRIAKKSLTKAAAVGGGRGGDPSSSINGEANVAIEAADAPAPLPLHVGNRGTVEGRPNQQPGPDLSTTTYMHKSRGRDQSDSNHHSRSISCNGNGHVGGVPGPGSYDPKDVIRGGWHAGITMGAPRPGDKPPATPGPGNYEIPDPRSQSPAFSMGRKSSTGHRHSRDIPGPGSYFITRHSRGTGSTTTLSQGSAADPDSISTASGRLHELPERRRHPRDTSPGPASYNVSSRITASTAPAFTFGSHLPHSIFNDRAACTPGPGAYCVERCSVSSMAGGGASPSFTIQGRDSMSDSVTLRRNTATPGPGAYEQRSYLVEGPALSLGKRLPMPRQATSPGPGAYHQEGKPMGPSFSLFRRNIFCSRPDRGTPGPGSYYNAAALSRPSSPAFSISAKSSPAALGCRRLRQGAAPGPGAYTLPTTLEGPYFSLLSRTAPPSRKSSETPGPGRYNLDSTGRPHSPAFSFGCKTPSEVRTSPGPGQYDPQKLTRKPVSFSFGMRPPQGKRVMGPGPGSYDPRSTVSGPSHSLHGRFRTSYTATSPCKYFPGPGTYNIKARLRGPAFTLPSRLDGPRDAWQPQTPGPGAYELGSSCVSHSPPKFSLGQRLNPIDRESRPGPGSYNLPLQSCAPAFSMLRRF